MKTHARFFFLILICILTVFPVGIASAEADGAKPFSTDYEAINEAAQSMFLVEVYGANDTVLGTGSGFIAFDEHYFVTNHHVIEDAKYLIVVDDNGKEYKVIDLLVADEEKDIAILSFDEAANYRPLPLCVEDNLLRGQPIVAIGSPKGVRNTVTTGNISNLIDDNGTHIIQFTAAASPGSSGGAIFNDRGEVIGLIFSKRNDAENMNYAVSIDEVILLKNTDFTLTSLNNYNITPNDILNIQNRRITFSKKWDDRYYRPSLTFRNIIAKGIHSFILYYSYNPLSKNNHPYIQSFELSIPAQKTIGEQVIFNACNADSQYVYIGVKLVKFNDGTTIKCEDEDVVYSKFPITIDEESESEYKVRLMFEKYHK